MWFTPKQKNRRLGREHVLDVRLRTRPLRHLRLRLAAVALAISLGTVLSLYLIWRAGDWVLNAFLFRHPAFAVRQLEIHTDGLLPSEQIRRWAGVREGDNLLALDLSRVKRDLELVPWIGAASVERRLPSILRLRVTERQAIAEVRVPRLRGGQGGVELLSHYLDPSGYVMQAPAFDDGQAAARALPLLEGLGGIPLRPGQVVSSPKVQAALQLIAESQRSPMHGLAGWRRLDLGHPEILELHTAEGSTITFGLERPADQLRRWRLVHDFGQQKGKTIRWLDLSVTNNCPVVWLETEASPAPPNRPAQASSNPQRHV